MRRFLKSVLMAPALALTAANEVLCRVAMWAQVPPVSAVVVTAKEGTAGTMARIRVAAAAFSSLEVVFIDTSPYVSGARAGVVG